MDQWNGYVFPDLVLTLMDLLDGTGSAAAHPSMPAGFASDTDKMIVVANSGGNLNDEGDTFYGIVRVETYAPTYPLAVDLGQRCQVKIETCPATEIGTAKTLVDSAELWTGPMEQPDDYPDDRRITTFYRLGVRRQVKPG